MSAAAEIGAKAGWMLAVAIAGIGYFAVVGPSEAHLAELGVQADALSARILADERAVHDTGRLNQLQRDISSELAGVNMGTDRAGVIAEFLREVETRSRMHRVRLVSVQNELTAAGSSPRATGGAEVPANPFESAFVDIVLQGRYGAVLQTIADLSRARVLMKIEQSSMDRAKGHQDDRAPLLSVQLKLAVFYLHEAVGPGTNEPHAT
jgi:hypothetical protein